MTIDDLLLGADVDPLRNFRSIEHDAAQRGWKSGISQSHSIIEPIPFGLLVCCSDAQYDCAEK